MQDELIFALDEEIGNPKTFTGRKKELAYFLNWCENAKERQSQSTALLARRKKGKTALVQRLYNILYTRNDPMLIPFYYRMEEGNMTLLDYSNIFYRSLIGQYLAFKKREPHLILTRYPFADLLKLSKDDPILHEDIALMCEITGNKNAGEAWEFARASGHRLSGLKNERIIQILDEFQFLNAYIYTDETYEKKCELVGYYNGTAESKISPQLVTGSYIGWLTALIRQMVSRYEEYYLQSFPEDEALDAVYNYSTLLRQPVTDETAPIIAEICDNDPYYISRIIMSKYDHKDLTDAESVLATLRHETTLPGGQIAKMWMEYIWEAFDKVNDRNAKAIVLYLAKYGGEERTREQILKDLKLEISDGELEEKLYKLEKADIIAIGSSSSRYKGLGDKIFEIVFRRRYEEEITRIDQKNVEAEIQRQLKSLKGQISHYKGISSEYHVINLLVFALYRGWKLENIVEKVLPGLAFGPFISMEKKTFDFGQQNRVEVDIFCKSAVPDGMDFIVEVKDWKTEVTGQAVDGFIAKKQKLEKHLKKKAGYIFYSENGMPEKLAERLLENGIMVTCRERLVGNSVSEQSGPN
jgi:hypothetical protein